MTDTNSFRRYSYPVDTSYAIKAFSASRSSAAPAYYPQEEPENELRVRQHKGVRRKSRQQLKAEQRQGRKNALLVISVVGLCFAMAFGVLHSYVQKNELSHQIATVQSQLDNEKSESTRLNAELDSLVSVSQIDQYAVEELGMTRMQANQIRYIDVDAFKAARVQDIKGKSPAYIMQSVNK